MLRQRIVTALILAVVVLLVIFYVPHSWTLGIIALLVLAGAWEWSAFPGFRRLASRLFYVAAIAVCVALVARSDDATQNFVLSAAVAWWFIALLWIVWAPDRINPVVAVLAGGFVLVPAWLAIGRLHEHGPRWLLFLLLLVVAADVGAYFAGRAFGRHKLAPRVSPGKTWEGVAGGFAAAALLALTGPMWLNVQVATFLPVCMLVVVASIVGDLTESMFKRHAGLKDSGTLLPGHGGVLDRVDSVTAAAPLFVIALEQLGLL